MKYNIDYIPKNKLTIPCEFLTEEKTIQFRENARGKTVSMLSREHKCLRTNKIISVYNDCMECEHYNNYVEIIEQQAEKIAFLENENVELQKALDSHLMSYDDWCDRWENNE